jgi:hypothetical protein
MITKEGHIKLDLLERRLKDAKGNTGPEELIEEVFEGKIPDDARIVLSSWHPVSVDCSEFGVIHIE